MQKLLFLDTETTGVNTNKDLITGLAAIKLFRDKNGEIKKEGFKAHVKPIDYPNISYDIEAQEKTGISFEALADFHEEDLVLTNFIKWLREEKKSLSWDQRYCFIAYNAIFDWKMVKRLFQCHKIPQVFNELFLPAPLDVLTQCFLINKYNNVNSELNLEGIARHFKIEVNSDSLHDAFEDTKLLMELFLKTESKIPILET